MMSKLDQGTQRLHQRRSAQDGPHLAGVADWLPAFCCCAAVSVTTCASAAAATAAAAVPAAGFGALLVGVLVTGSEDGVTAQVQAMLQLVGMLCWLHSRLRKCSKKKIAVKELQAVLKSRRHISHQREQVQPLPCL